jgi:hypothetical protein
VINSTTRHGVFSAYAMHRLSRAYNAMVAIQPKYVQRLPLSRSGAAAARREARPARPEAGGARQKSSIFGQKSSIFRKKA